MKKLKYWKLKILDKLHLTRYYRRTRKCNVGEYTYFSHNTQVADKKNVFIGKYCSLANGVCIGIGNHPYDVLTTHPFTYMDNDIQLYGDMPVAEKNRIKRPIPAKTVIGNDARLFLHCSKRLLRGEQGKANAHRSGNLGRLMGEKQGVQQRAQPRGEHGDKAWQGDAQGEAAHIACQQRGDALRMDGQQKTSPMICMKMGYADIECPMPVRRMRGFV